MKIHYRTKSGEHYLLNVESNTTMQKVITKIQEQGGLQLSQVSLSMVKNSCKCGHDLTHYLLEDTSENIPIEVEFGHEEANYYTNLLFEKTKLAKLKDDIVSEIKTEIKTVINAKFDGSNKKHPLKKQLDSLRQDFLENNKIINHLFEEYKSL